MKLEPDSIERYDDARRKGILEDWLARLKGKQGNLLPYEAVASVLKTFEHRQLTELRVIPLDKIVGSVGRHRDFTRNFMPRRSIERSRWVLIDMAMNSQLGVPPIEVYQIGEAYFVSDGNHRVSVARANGFKDIEAYVTVIPGIVDIQVGDTLDEAIIKAECSHFLAQTRLGEGCEELDIHFTKPGSYPRLLEHIYTHLYFMKLHRAAKGIEQKESLNFPAAARDWYDNVYLPIVTAVKSQGLLERFPGSTASDLYVWLSGRMMKIAEQKGQEVSAEIVTRLVVEEGTPSLYLTMRRLLDQLKGISSHRSRSSDLSDEGENTLEK